MKGLTAEYADTRLLRSGIILCDIPGLPKESRLVILWITTD